MKWLAFAIAGIVLAVVFLWPNGSTGPEPIAFGRDACARCRMVISSPGFGGEMRRRDGELEKFDDVGCLVQAMLAERADIPEAWVEDHATGELVPLLAATLVRTADVATPMGHGLVAFADEREALDFAAAHEGTTVAFEDLVRDTVRLARTPSHRNTGGHP